MPRAQIRDEEIYWALRCEGNGGGRSGDYADWTKKDLVERAREIGIRGRSSMTKPELISALRGR